MDAFTGQDIKSIKSIDNIVGIDMSPANNYVVSGSEFGPAKNIYTVYDIETLSKVLSFKAKFEFDPSSFAFSQDGRYCLFLCKESYLNKKYNIELWDTVTGRKIHTTEMDKTIWNIAISPDGKYGLVAGDESLLFDTHTGETLKKFSDEQTYFCPLFCGWQTYHLFRILWLVTNSI